MVGRLFRRRTPSEQIQERIREARQKGLKHLALSVEFFTSDSEKLAEVPAEVFELVQLESLNLSYNQLTQVPETITRLQNLTYLRLSYNQLTEVPESITRLQNLAYLDLSGTQLTQVPESITRLQNLAYLDLSGTQLTQVPESITRLQNLTQLDLESNPIELPPPDVVNKGIEAIRDYFRQLHSEGEDYIYEAKLLIVGEAGAGKTSLARKIENPDYDLPPERDSDTTKGVDVIHWEFELPPDVPGYDKVKNQGRKFRVNIWDFGGQEIYHATHQFFLTRRSLYVLVADDRKENMNFYYWLNMVELLSGNSPLLIVKNEKLDRHREINERQLRERFANLKETLATNLADNRGLKEIIREVKHYVSSLPHIGTPLPSTWVKVREQLEKDSRDYIGVDEYLSICEENGFSEYKDKLQLSDHLHNLGVILHFQNDPVLYHTVILKPEWGTDAVYKVLDNEEVSANQGRFSQGDLKNIWSSPEYTGKHHELLRLMLNFQLCYQLPESQDTYITPEWLTASQPNYKWDTQDNLILHYYSREFMPRGIITRFIVAMHQNIEEQRYVWKSGVVLRCDQGRAEVIEHYGCQDIQVRVAGQDKKGLMSIIVYELDKIYQSYHGLNYNKLIPCNCGRCKNSQDPHFYPFENLRKRIADQQRSIQCEKSYEMVDAWRLINDVIKADVHQVSEEVAPVSVEEFGKLAENIENVQLNIVRDKSHFEWVQHMNQDNRSINDRSVKIGDDTTLNAPIVTADTIENAFNTVAQSGLEGQLKETLQELIKAVTEISQSIPEDKGQSMANDVEALSKELTTSKRPGTVQRILGDIRDTATTVGQIAMPVLEVIEKLSPLLAGAV
jgi:internalin A